MKVKELIKQLRRTNPENEVRIITPKEYSKNIYLSFDDIGDVLIYEVKKWILTIFRIIDY